MVPGVGYGTGYLSRSMSRSSKPFSILCKEMLQYLLEAKNVDVKFQYGEEANSLAVLDLDWANRRLPHVYQ